MFLVRALWLCIIHKSRVGHSDVVSFLNCRSSANIFTALQMNEVKKKTFSAKLDIGRLIMNASTFSYKIRYLIALCSHALTQFFSEA